MKDRIQQLIDSKGISPGDLAEVLEVQRSNISHILNGRNKPGAVFIEKLLQAFPDVNARWLLTGQGQMLSSGAPGSQRTTVKPAGETTIQSQLFPPAEKPRTSLPAAEEDKTIEKIILLYSDGTFTYYNSF